MWSKNISWLAYTVSLVLLIFTFEMVRVTIQIRQDIKPIVEAAILTEQAIEVAGQAVGMLGLYATVLERGQVQHEMDQNFLRILSDALAGKGIPLGAPVGYAPVTSGGK